MTDLLATLMLLAQESPGPGRGDNPDDGAGVLIIVAIVLAVLVGGFLLHAAFQRFGRSKSRAMERRPAPQGRVGRISEFEDGPRR